MTELEMYELWCTLRLWANYNQLNQTIEKNWLSNSFNSHIIDVRAEDEFARVELLLSLKQELERLSPRELMIIRTYFDYPIEVVARKLKVRPNTISKARRKIARELRKKLV